MEDECMDLISTGGSKQVTKFTFYALFLGSLMLKDLTFGDLSNYCRLNLGPESDWDGM